MSESTDIQQSESEKMIGGWRKGLEPEFLSAVASIAIGGSGVSAETLENYFKTRLYYIDAQVSSTFGKLLVSTIRSDLRVVTEEKLTSHALPKIDFVYMDVGCWAGDGEDKNGWARHREFGIVFGQFVLLCAFARPVKDKLPAHYACYANPVAWNGNAQKLTHSALVDGTLTGHPDWPKLGRLLTSLATCIPGSNLYILGATYLRSIYIPAPECGQEAPITIFLGDLHAPAATNSADAHIVEGGREMLRGRLETTTDEMRGLPASPGTANAAATYKLAQQVQNSMQDLDWKQTATRESIDNWVRLYHVDGQKSADIFQGAGMDLRNFVDALAKFHREVEPLELIQVGDMFDLWLGFQRAFGERMGKIAAVDNMRENAQEFARFWVERSLLDTHEGPHLVHLLTLGDWAGKNRQTGVRLRTTFLHGNHDNYLKHGSADHPIIVPPGREHSGMKIRAFHLPSSVERPGLLVEHGHQSDSFNRDENPSGGHALTQAAFFLPGVRSIEKPAGWLINAGNGGTLQRTLTIRHALNRCLLDHLSPHLPQLMTCRGVYVMGHTHEPMLKRIELWPCIPPRYP